MVAPVPCTRQINQIVARSVAGLIYTTKRRERGRERWRHRWTTHNPRAVSCTRGIHLLLLDDTYARGFRKHRYRDQPEEIPSVSSRRRMELDGFEDPRGESDGWPRLKLITTFCLPSSASTLPNEPIPLPFLGGVYFYPVW